MIHVGWMGCGVFFLVSENMRAWKARQRAVKAENVYILEAKVSCKRNGKISDYRPSKMDHGKLIVKAVDCQNVAS